tara:strand:- start:327 stop:521 length:195 start_codon:yes stop_codon:yes gene_type:complete
MSKNVTTYYYYDHTYGQGYELGDLGALMDFIDESYDLDRHSIQDSLEGHELCCQENDNQIEEGE